MSAIFKIKRHEANNNDWLPDLPTEREYYFFNRKMRKNYLHTHYLKKRNC